MNKSHYAQTSPLIPKQLQESVFLTADGFKVKDEENRFLKLFRYKIKAIPAQKKRKGHSFNEVDETQPSQRNFLSWRNLQRVS